jgi:hypothetical protein
MNILLNLLLFFRELLEQVAEFEKAEFVSSSKKVDFSMSKSVFVFTDMIIPMYACLFACVGAHVHSCLSSLVTFHFTEAKTFTNLRGHQFI